MLLQVEHQHHERVRSESEVRECTTHSTPAARAVWRRAGQEWMETAGQYGNS